jgi:hypothetical protein
MVEKLLTIKEIEIIQQTVRLNPALRHPNVISGGNERTSIYKVSPICGLVFVKGDGDTGFSHINDRHSYWSEKYYWKEEGKHARLDNPSKFSRKSIPIGDYINIADQLYSPENLNIEKNRSPDLFEMYTGIVRDENNGESKYHMLIYKSTKIVHTLFPHSKTHNKKKHINYRRGKPKGKMWLEPFRSSIVVPYLDSRDRVVFSFQVLKDLERKTEQGILINHKLDKHLVLFERDIDHIEEIGKDVEMMERADLSQVERIIKKIEK